MKSKEHVNEECGCIPIRLASGNTRSFRLLALILPVLLAMFAAYVVWQVPARPKSADSGPPEGGSEGVFENSYAAIPRLGRTVRGVNPHQYEAPLLAVAKRLGADTLELRLIPSVQTLEDQVSLDLGVGVAYLERRSYRSENFQVVVQGKDGSVTVADPGEVRTYVGRLSSQKDATVKVLIAGDGIIGQISDPLEGTISIDPLTEEEASTLAHTIPGEGILHAFHTPLYGAAKNTAPFPDYYDEEGFLVSALGGDGVVGMAPGGGLAPRIVDNVCVKEAELGMDVAFSFFSQRGGSSIATTKNLMEAWLMNELGVFERDCLVRHVLGTLVIRTNDANDPYRTNNGATPLLELTRSNWNTSGFPTNLNTSQVTIFQGGTNVTTSGPAVSQHDLAITILNRSTGVTGLAYVGTVGTSNRYSHVTAASGLGFWRNGGQHEIGHSWSLRHGDGCNQEPWVNGNSSTGIICGSEQTRANAVEVGKILIHRDSRGPGVLPDTIPSGPLAPYCMIDRLQATVGNDSMLDVLANDHDVNNDNFFIGELRRSDSGVRSNQATPTPMATVLGGTIIRSIGTGSNGRDEVMYTPPPNPALGSTDSFFYLVEDLTGQRNWGYVEVIITDGVLFEESFVYSDGDLAGNTNGGATWNSSGNGGLGVVGQGSISLSVLPDFASKGGAVTQTSSNRESLALPSSLNLGTDGSTIYVSFIQDLVGASTSTTRIVEFWDGGANDANRTFSFGTYTDVISVAPDYGLFIERNSDQIALEAGTADGDAHLIVLRIEYGAGNSDTISIYRDPGTSEPAVPDAVVTATDLVFNRIGFGSFQGGSQLVDEIRIGTSFDAVVPVIGAVPFFEEHFDYSNGPLAGEMQSGQIWTDITGGGSTDVSTGSLEPVGLAGFEVVGGKATQLASDRLALLLPSEATGGEDGTTLYVSFVQALIGDSTTTTRIVELWNGSANDANRTLSFGTYTDVVSTAPDYGLFIERNSLEIAREAGTADSDPHLIVLKFEYGAGDADKVSVYRDPGVTEPASPTATAFAPDLVFNRIGFGSFQGGDQVVDSLRVGPTFGSVVVVNNPDSDGDGLPDSFEEDHYGEDLTITDGTDDLDRDGQDDRSEFFAGTDPSDPGSVFRIIGFEVVSPTEVRLTWSSVAGKNYSIWASSSPDLSNWEAILSSKIALTSETTALVSRSNLKEFFRVQVN